MVLITPARLAYLLVLAFLPVLLSIPLPQYPDSLCSLICASSSSFQYFASRPLTIPGLGIGICFFRIQRRSVVMSTTKSRLASDIE